MEEIFSKWSERTIFWFSDSDLKPDGFEVLLRFKGNPKAVKEKEIVDFLEKAVEFYKSGYESPEYVFKNVKHRKRIDKELSPVKNVEGGIRKFFIELLKKCTKKEKEELRELLISVLRRIEFEINKEQGNGF
ncbi:hypothetical protein DRQ09_05495 [candidate division KSB1 bacterium]|nr:MAG: hypothetical protein DRQ09_05495 [candidate division KSB1 bacterium]